MSDPLSFLPYYPDEAPLDWRHHHPERARERLAASADAALKRRLREGARRFMPDRPLVEAINAAIASRSPLLLTGEPGTGKTQVAYYLAEYYRIPLYHYQVHSESTARDLRYDFDAVAYLRDAYLASLDRGDGTQSRPALERTDARYLHKGRLWQAYEHPGECVLLIDEIDKAPRDFPNDLLQELADYCFDHPFPPHPPIERGADQPPPLVVITSNGERRLPDPFLRRAIVHHIELDERLLVRILGAWQDAFSERLPPPLQARALGRFWEVRNRLERQGGRLPGAAEFLIWLTVLAAAGTAAPDLEAQPLLKLPALHCLIKDHEDLAHLRA